MEETSDRPNLLNQVLKFGVLIAMVNIIVTLFIYIVDVTLMAKWWFALVVLLVNIILVFYAGFNYRKQNGGYLLFKDAFIFTFLVLVCSGLIGLLFNMVMHTVIDPDLSRTITEASIEESTAMMERMGMADDQIDEAMENVRAGMADQFSVPAMLKGFLISLVIYAVGALIVGAIIKKSRPEFE